MTMESDTNQMGMGQKKSIPFDNSNVTESNVLYKLHNYIYLKSSIIICTIFYYIQHYYPIKGELCIIHVKK